MNLQLLIDSIVRQTTVLIAQLATAQGVRAPLAHVANQVFLELAEELHRQGVSRKVGADMFGMALRTYLRKIQRLGEGETDRGCSLSEAVLGHLRECDSGGQGVVLRADLLARFHRDEPNLVRSVLHDLCDNGLAFRTGRGDATGYRAATDHEMGELAGSGGGDELLWAVVYREGSLSQQQLQALAQSADVEAGLCRLVDAGRVERQTRGGQIRYSAQSFFVPREARDGWEGAVFDHFQAMVKTIAARLTVEPEQRDHVGGSTYSYDVWPGHPFRDRVLAQLAEFRDRASALRESVSQYNRAHGRPRRYTTVTAYAGQSLQEEEAGAETEREDQDDEV